MSKSVTRTVLAVARATYSTVVDPDGAVYDSGPLYVGDLVELGVSIDIFGVGANISLFAVDANGHFAELFSGSNPTYINVGSGFGTGSGGVGTDVPASFGDTVQIKAYPQSGYSSASFGLSVEGK